MPQIAGYYRPTHSHLVFTFASICFNICAFVADGDWRLDFGMCVMASGTCCSLWCFWSCPYPLLIRAFCPCLSADCVPYPAVSCRILAYSAISSRILSTSCQRGDSPALQWLAPSIHLQSTHGPLRLRSWHPNTFTWPWVLFQDLFAEDSGLALDTQNMLS